VSDAPSSPDSLVRKGLTPARITIAATLALSVVILDQASKLWAVRSLAGQVPMTIVENFFHLAYHRNAGGVFGLFASSTFLEKRIFFIAATILALALIVYYLREFGGESFPVLVGLSLITGGAVGNLIDRILYGEVIDFIDWHWYDHHWPTFNIADSGITVGTILLLATLVLVPGERSRDKPQ
jgi:signal peptidase II